ncbi:hypothetical protein ACFO3J_22960 [Streptomyces polygonati]|uniref:Uncharacterized protein n=1 Tax=Streptomyces polygonati TaxID=1617087 RepID=A0ABV8HU23_9ACTN
MRIARTRRRAVLGSAALIMSAASAVAAAPAVFADTAPAETVREVVTGDDGRLTVQFTGGAQPRLLDVDVLSSTAADASTLLSITDFDGATTADPVRLPAGTAYRSYPVDIDYQLADGTVVHWSDAENYFTARLNYVMHDYVASFTTDRTSTDYDNRAVVLSGHLDAFDPATGRVVPAGHGQSVRLMWSELGAPWDWWPHNTVVTTDQNGDFRLPVMVRGTLLGANATATGASGDETSVPTTVTAPDVPAVPATYRISSAPSVTRLHKGASFTVKGKVERLTATGWKPFVGVPVVTSTLDPDNGHYMVLHKLGETTTGADGGFSYPVVAARTTTLHTYVRPTPYLPPVVQNVATVHVPTPGSITLPAWSIDDHAVVTTTGRLTGDASGQSLWLQYSPNGKSGWGDVAHITTGAAHGGYSSFLLRTDRHHPDGYYRVVHAESAQMLGLVTPAHRLTRVSTRVAIVRRQPTRPQNADSNVLTFVSVRELTPKGWVPYKHASVALVYRSTGKPAYTRTWYGSTDAAGHFMFSTAAWGDGTWGAYLRPDSKHFSTATKLLYVDVLH